MNDLEFLAPVALFVCIAAVMILRGPIGKAVADRLAGRAGGAEAETSGRPLAELDELRHRVAELEERLDFTERLVARERRQLAQSAEPPRRA